MSEMYINIYSKIPDIFKNKKFWIILGIVIIIAAIIFSTYKYQSNNKTIVKSLLNEIKTNNIKIDKLTKDNTNLQNKYNILLKEEQELKKNINNIYDKNKSDSEAANKKETDIINESKSIVDNIKYLNNKYGIK
jgi:ABC-type antimicrobial peptide transport system permease subunit